MEIEVQPSHLLYELEKSLVCLFVGYINLRCEYAFWRTVLQVFQLIRAACCHANCPPLHDEEPCHLMPDAAAGTYYNCSFHSSKIDLLPDY